MTIINIRLVEFIRIRDFTEIPIPKLFVTRDWARREENKIKKKISFRVPKSYIGIIYVLPLRILGLSNPPPHPWSLDSFIRAGDHDLPNGLRPLNLDDAIQVPRHDDRFMCSRALRNAYLETCKYTRLNYTRGEAIVGVSRGRSVKHRKIAPLFFFLLLACALSLRSSFHARFR